MNVIIQSTIPSSLARSARRRKMPVVLRHERLTSLEELTEEHRERRHFDGVHEQHCPQYRPVSVVEHRSGHTRRPITSTGEYNHAQTGTHARQHKVNTHRSRHPYEIVHPRAESEDA